MFVSTYSTYIQPNRIEKERQERLDISKEQKRLFPFSQMHLDASKSEALLAKKFPVDYVSSFKALFNQNRLQQSGSFLQEEQKNFTQTLTRQHAQEAYLQNAAPFLLSKRPKLTLSQTPSLSMSDNSPLTQGKLKALRVKMIETYEQNDLYFKRSA